MKGNYLFAEVVFIDVKNINCSKKEEEEFLDLFEPIVKQVLLSKNNINHIPLTNNKTGEKVQLTIERFRVDKTNKSCEEIENFDYYIGKFQFDTDKSLKVQVIVSDPITGKATLYQN